MLTPAEGNMWIDAASGLVKKYPGLVLECQRMGADLHEEPSAPRSFAKMYGLSPTGAVLVRPDGFVGWRTMSAPNEPESALAQVLGQLLKRYA